MERTSFAAFRAVFVFQVCR